NCGYNLTGLTRDVCPECGQAFNRGQIADYQRKHVRPTHTCANVGLFLLVPGLWPIAVNVMLYTRTGMALSDDITTAYIVASVGISLWLAYRLVQIYKRHSPMARAVLALVFFWFICAAQWCVGTILQVADAWLFGRKI